MKALLVLLFACQAAPAEEAHLRWPAPAPCVAIGAPIDLPLSLDCQRCPEQPEAEELNGEDSIAAPPLTLRAPVERLDWRLGDLSAAPTSVDALSLAPRYESPSARLFWIARLAPPRGNQIGEEPAWLQVGLRPWRRQPYFLGAMFERERDGPLQFAEQGWRPAGLMLGLRLEF